MNRDNIYVAILLVSSAIILSLIAYKAVTSPPCVEYETTQVMMYNPALKIPIMQNVSRCVKYAEE